MPITTYLDHVEALLRQGNATEHSYRLALKTLFESVLTGTTATNEPRHADYGAPHMWRLFWKPLRKAVARYGSSGF